MVTTTEENIKIVGEVGRTKVFIASCNWATSLHIQSCFKLKCDNYVFGTAVDDEDPYVVGWCHELDKIISSAEAWVKILQRRVTPATVKSDNKKRTYPGYI